MLDSIGSSRSVPPGRVPGDAPDDDMLGPCADDRQACRAARDADASLRLVNFVAAATDAERTRAIRAFCIDSFTISVPAGEGIRRVTVPFRINYGDSPSKRRALERMLQGSPAARSVPHVVCGRPTPAQLKQVVGELARRNPAAFAPEKTRDQIRAYLADLGVGIDCAGTVVQAFYACHGVSENAGRRRFGLRELHEGIFANIDRNRAFERVADPVAVCPGDLIILAPPPDDEFGHKVLVTEKRFGAIGDTPVVLISVMSSWGQKGPAERTWAYDPAARVWTDLGGTFTDGTPFASPASGPWDHPMQGIYHAR
jgi:hypothetical protein